MSGRPAVIALGGNLGDRARILADAVRDLAETDGIELTAISPFLETPALRPDGIDLDAPAYLNGVVLIRATLEPLPLLDRLDAIERSHGRERAERWGDRTLDLDLIDYDGRELDVPRLTLPHPRAHQRDFVLRPWLLVDPDATLPRRGRADALLDQLERQHRLDAGEAP
jgi:2-amino-4-hydroxy-6-hydroxymethyldihydropteridine diphosphokinase